MPKFQQSDFKVNGEQGLKEVRVVKVEQGAAPRIQSFELPTLEQAERKGHHGSQRHGAGNFSAFVGAPGQSARTQKDSRFSLSHLVRSHLSVEEEERRAIDAKVQERVNALAGAAKAKAAEKGYQEGLEKGREEAFAKFQAEGSGHLARLESLLGEIEMSKEEIFRANERFLMELIYKVAKTILLKELSADRDYVCRLVKELINRVGVKENITIKISPSEAESIGMLKEGLVNSFGELRNVNIEVSAQVEQGGCMLETEWNAIDASIETQLNGIYEALLGRKADGGEA